MKISIVGVTQISNINNRRPATAAVCITSALLCLLFNENIFQSNFVVTAVPAAATYNTRGTNNNVWVNSFDQFSAIKAATPSTAHQAQYQTINENVIKHFLKRYKHIYVATLLACPSDTSNYLKFVNIEKHLMAAGISIKAVDIDSTSTSTSSVFGGRRNANFIDESGDVQNVAAAAYDNNILLKSGDLKQAVVLDLTCSNSQFVLQQVQKY